MGFFSDIVKGVGNVAQVVSPAGILGDATTKGGAIGPKKKKMTPGGGYDPGAGGNFDPLVGTGAEPRLPLLSDFPTIVDETGKLQPGFQFNVGDLEGYDEFRDLATGTGLSAWGQAATDRLGTQLGLEREGLQRQGQSAIAQAMSNLMQSGGLTSGARERIQSRGAKDILSARQATAGQGLLGQADISMKDAAARQGALGGLLDLGSAARQTNLQTKIGEVGAQRGFEMDRAKLDLAKFLAEKKAAALREQAGNVQPGQGIISDDIPILGWL